MVVVVWTQMWIDLIRFKSTILFNSGQNIETRDLPRLSVVYIQTRFELIFFSIVFLGGRYSVLPNGELHVHRISDEIIVDGSSSSMQKLSQSSSTSNESGGNSNSNNNNNNHQQRNKLMFRCQTKHILSGQTKLSGNYGRLIVTGKSESRITQKQCKWVVSPFRVWREHLKCLIEVSNWKLTFSVAHNWCALISLSSRVREREREQMREAERESQFINN